MRSPAEPRWLESQSESLHQTQCDSSGFDHHFSGLVASLALFESNAFDIPGFEGKEGALDRPGAADELADAFRRGDACTAYISTVDFFERKDDLLVDIQAEFGVVPPPKD